MAVRTRANMKTTIDGNITTNGVGAVTGAVVNSDLKDLCDSALFPEDFPIFRIKVTVAGGAGAGNLRSIGTSPVTMIAAPGANKFLNIISITHSYKYGTTTYTFTANGVFRFAGAGSAGWVLDSSHLNAVASLNTTTQDRSTASGLQAATNTAFQLGTVDNSNSGAAGDGDIDVVIYYTIEDTNT
jgi:hypothetical protein